MPLNISCWSRGLVGRSVGGLNTFPGCSSSRAQVLWGGQLGPQPRTATHEHPRM